MRVMIVFFLLSIVGNIHSPAANAQECLPTHLEIGSEARVTPGASNRMRSEPNTSAEQIGQIPAGDVMTILDGPQCNDGFLWWQVRYNTLEGWTVEGNDTDYFLEPVSSAATNPETCDQETRLVLFEHGQVSSDIPSRLRFEPTVNGEQIGQVDATEIFQVVDGPTCADGFNWWQVVNNGVMGWLAEGDGETYFVEPFTNASRIESALEAPLITHAVSWNADGSRLAIATSLGVFIYNTEDWSQEPYWLANGVFASDLSFSPVNPDLLVINSDMLIINRTDTLYNFRVYLISDASEELLFQLDLSEGPIGPLLSASDFTFSSDGKQLSFGGMSFEVFDAETWTQINQLEIFDLDAGCCHLIAKIILPSALSPSADYGAGVVDEESVQLFDFSIAHTPSFDKPDPRASLFDRGGRTQTITTLKFSPDGTQLLAGDDTGSLQMWGVETGTRMSFIRAENQTSISNRINDIAFHPDGEELVTAESDPRGVLRVFTTEGLEPEMVFISDDYHTNAYAVAYSPDGKTLVAVLDDVIYLLETNDYTVTNQITIQLP